MSAPTLSNFVSELHNRNIARPNLYYVDIIPPRALSGTTDNNLVSMWCHTAMTPQVTILTQDTHTEAGVRRKYAYDQDYQYLTLGFYIDQAFDIKMFFDKWKHAVVPQKRNFGYPIEYTADNLIVYILDQTDKVTYKYEYYKVFPKSVSAVDLSYANGNATATFTVDFVFEECFFSKMSGGVETFTSRTKADESKPVPFSNQEINQEMMGPPVPKN